MPPSQAPIDVNEPKGPVETDSVPDNDTIREASEPDSPAPVVRGSRWVDYDTHELLEMISELEDERRWARLREGIWIAILVHLALLSAFTWIPKYVFKVPQVIDPIDAIKQRKDLQYLDLPPDALRTLQPKPKIKPAPEKQPRIDKKTLEAMNRPAPPPSPVPEPPTSTPAPALPTVTQPPPPPAPQALVDAPRPAAVPARPNFAMSQQNPTDQLRDAIRGAARNPGSGSLGNLPSSGLRGHPGAGTGGVEVLSDTQGVDFRAWLQRWHWETEHTWDPLIPDEVNAPILKKGQVMIRFRVGPDGRVLTPMYLEGRSGDTALDRAAWGAITGSNYPPLPKEFHGPYIELRALFMYNMQPQ